VEFFKEPQENNPKGNVGRRNAFDNAYTAFNQLAALATTPEQMQQVNALLATLQSLVNSTINQTGELIAVPRLN
jgi:hypothetical protein